VRQSSHQLTWRRFRGSKELRISPRKSTTVRTGCWVSNGVGLTAKGTRPESFAAWKEGKEGRKIGAARGNGARAGQGRSFSSRGRGGPPRRRTEVWRRQRRRERQKRSPDSRWRGACDTIMARVCLSVRWSRRRRETGVLCSSSSPARRADYSTAIYW